MDLLYNDRHNYINICKYLKKTAYINMRITVKITYKDNTKKLTEMIETHNNLLDKFEKLYTKYINTSGCWWLYNLSRLRYIIYHCASLKKLKIIF